MTKPPEQQACSRSQSGVTRILIADDHDIVRRGVRAVLEGRSGWEVVGEANNGSAALELVEKLEPDVTIVDYSMPSMNGAQLTRRIKAACPRTEVLVFTMHDSDLLVREALDAGARGFLLKSDADRQLVQAVESLARRQPYFTGRITETFMKLYLAQPTDVSHVSVLTPREREVVQLIAEGHSSKDASEILSVSLKTVEAHRAAAMHKLNLTTTAALVRYAVRNRLVEP
ncbi:response regulator [Alsobacter sp. SYSU BS001988]|jgi:DNA-binding NarL/FixJ family response regulator